jgi:hypothetical protein
MPLVDNGTLTHPVNKFAAFHTDWPWRMRISSDMMFPLCQGQRRFSMNMAEKSSKKNW